MTDKRPQLLTLSKLQVLYLALLLLFVLPAVVLLGLGPSVGNIWCREIEMPSYEKTFGFRLGSLGDGHGPAAIISVVPGGIFATAGIQPGDRPRVYHGVADFCAELDAASQGREVALDFRAPGEDKRWKKVKVRAHH